MFRTALRTSSAPLRHRAIRPQVGQQFRAASTGSATPAKGRGFKNTLLRLAVVTGGLYYASTSDFFSNAAENVYAQRRKELHAGREKVKEVPHAVEEEEETPREVDLKKLVQEAKAKEEETKKETIQEVVKVGEQETTPGGSPEELEQEAGQQGAFNPETGEINWDCPCLGGMAHGPCGPQFRDAFSCFVYSTEEPKGVECIEKFKAMQDCFRLHPEVYGEELQSEEEEEAEVDEKLAAIERNKRDAEADGERKDGPVSTAVSEQRARDIDDKESSVNSPDNYTVNGGIEPKLKQFEAKAEEKDDIPVEERK